MAREGADITHIHKFLTLRLDFNNRTGNKVEMGAKTVDPEESRTGGQTFLFVLFNDVRPALLQDSSRAEAPPEKPLHRQKVSVWIHSINNWRSPPRRPTLERGHCCRQTRRYLQFRSNPSPHTRAHTDHWEQPAERHIMGPLGSARGVENENFNTFNGNWFEQFVKTVSRGTVLCHEKGNKSHFFWVGGEWDVQTLHTWC